MRFGRAAGLLIVALPLCFALPAHALDLQNLWDKASKSIEDNVGKKLEETIDKVFGNEDQQPAATQGQAPPAASGQGAQQPPSPTPQYNAAEVREAQRLLIDLGYNPGPIDGDYGSKTLRAILAFETDRGLPPSGKPTPEVIAHLRTAAAGVSPDTLAAPASEPSQASSWRAGAQIIPGNSAIRQVLSAEEADQLARFLTLLALRTAPPAEANQAAIDIDVCLANAFLSVDQMNQVLDPPRLQGRAREWKGTADRNEFEIERARHTFRTAYFPEILARAPALPLELVYVQDVLLQPYDHARGGFDLYGLSQLNRSHQFPFPRPTCGRVLEHLPFSTAILEFWAVDSATAEQLILRMPPEPSGRHIYFAAAFTLSPAPEAAVVRDNRPPQPVPLAITLSALSLYEDPKLERHLHTFELDAPAQAVLLSGIPEPLPRPETVALDEEAVALLLLKEHGDVLAPEAWHALALRQLAKDEAYYDRTVRRDLGNMVHTQTRTTFDPSYVPFFPRGFKLGVQAALDEMQAQRFRQWTHARAAVLPERLVFRGHIRRDRESGAVVLDLGTSLDQDRSGLTDDLLAQGYVADQILGIGLARVGSHIPFDTTFVSAPGTERVPVPVLPNLLASYAPQLAPADSRAMFGDSFETGWGRAATDLELIVDRTEMLEVDDRKALLVVHGTPTALRILNADGSGYVLEQTLDVAALDPTQAAASDLQVTPTQQGSLPFSAEVADLLVARYLPDALDQTTLERMLLARWHYEQAFDRGPDEPQWGRFFVKGKPKPDAQQRVELAPPFRDWTLERTHALPSTVTVVFPHPRTNRPGPVQLGADMRPEALGHEARTCQGRISILARQDPMRARAQESACAFLEQATGLLAPEVYLARGDPSQALAHFTDERLKRLPNPGSLPRHSGPLLAGPRVHCNVAMAGQDHYCRGGLAALDEELLGQPAALNDVLVLDQEVVIPDTPQIAQLPPMGLDLELDVEVVGISRSDHLSRHPAADAYERYRQFLAQAGIASNTSIRMRQDDEATVELFLMDARVREARLVEERSRQLVAVLPLQAMRTLDPSSLEVAAPEPVAAPVGPFGPDVVGVRLGMSFEDAERLIREHMAVGRSLVADRAWQVKAATGEIEPFTSGRLFESEDGSEIIVLYDEPPAAPGIVLGIVRQIALPKGQASPAQVVAQLEQKYGQAAQSTEQQLVWVEGQSPGQRPDRHCVPAPNAAADLRIWRDSEGADPSWQPTTLRYPQSTPGLGASAPGSPAAAASCRPVLAATFDTRQNREWDRLVLRVVDQRAYAEQHLESRRLIERGEGAIGAAGPAAAKVDLKL